MLRKILAVFSVAILIFGLLHAAALTFTQSDVNEDGVIDVLDLVRAKKLEVSKPQTYNADFIAELMQILLGNSQPEENTSSQENTGNTSSNTSSNTGGTTSSNAIYLPEIPC